MRVTFLALILVICGVMLMLWSGVTLIQDKKFPEVEGCKSLQHTGFNRKQQLCRLCVIFPLAALALAGIWAAAMHSA